MHTEHVKYLLPDYANGRLEEALRAGVEAHLRGCPECREELTSLEDLFSSLKAIEPPTPDASYFAGILPRVRQRLEQKERAPIFSSPVFVKLAAPLAVAVLAIVLLLHVPFPQERTERETNPLRSVVGGASTEELAEAVLENADRHPLSNSLGERELSSLTVDHVLRRHLVEDEAEVHEPELLEPLLSAVPSHILEGLSESEIDALLQRLGERTIL